MEIIQLQKALNQRHSKYTPGLAIGDPPKTEYPNSKIFTSLAEFREL